MALKMNDIQKLSPKEAEVKLVELQKAILEASGEGKTDAVKSMRKGIARLKTYLAGKNPSKKGGSVKPAKKVVASVKDEKP